MNTAHPGGSTPPFDPRAFNPRGGRGPDYSGPRPTLPPQAAQRPRPPAPRPSSGVPPRLSRPSSPYAGSPPRFQSGPAPRTWAPRPQPPSWHGAPVPRVPAGNPKSFVDRLMLRGIRGELVRWPSFQSIRRDNPDVFLYVSFGVACLLSFVLPQFTPTFGTMAGATLIQLMGFTIQFVLIYLYIALGTKLAHKFILMMCVIGAVVSLWGAFAFFSLMSLAGGANRLLGEEVVPTGWIAVPLVIYLVMVVVYGWLGVLVHRGMRRLDGHR
jgi:hypothetical protein